MDDLKAGSDASDPACFSRFLRIWSVCAILIDRASRAQRGAPENPRFRYAGRRFLYKLYVVEELQTGDESLEAGAIESFIVDLPR